VAHLLISPRPSDYDAIASWIVDAAECIRWGGPHIPFPFCGSDLPRLIANAPPIVPGETRMPFALAAEPAGSAPAVGFGELVREDRTSFRLGRLIVDPGSRGHGLGATLCRLLIAQAQSRAEAESVRLFVYRDNAPAIRLYSKLGFVQAAGQGQGEVLTMYKSIERTDGSF
jgi:[ribosomal protein S18]-alanine N-acetyltransferase